MLKEILRLICPRELFECSLGGGGGGGTTTVEKSAEPWEEQKPYLLDIFEQAKKQYQSGVPQYYPGNTVAPLSQDTLSAQDYLRNYAQQLPQQFQGLNQGATNYLTWAMSPEARMAESNPYLQSAIQVAQRPLIQQFTGPGGVLNNIRDDALQSGQYGGSRQGVAQVLGGDVLQQNLGDIATKMAMQNYLSSQDTATRAAGLMPGVQGAITQAGMLPGQIQDQIGQQNRAYEQALIDAAIQKHNFEQNVDAAKLAQYHNMISGNFGGTGTATSTQPTPYTNPVLGAAGGAATGFAVGGPWGALVGGLIGLLGS